MSKRLNFVYWLNKTNLLSKLTFASILQQKASKSTQQQNANQKQVQTKFNLTFNIDIEKFEFLLLLFVVVLLRNFRSFLVLFEKIKRKKKEFKDAEFVSLALLSKAIYFIALFASSNQFVCLLLARFLFISLCQSTASYD